MTKSLLSETGSETGHATRRARSAARTHRTRSAIAFAAALATLILVVVSAQHLGSFAVSQGVSTITAAVPALLASAAAAFVLLTAAIAFSRSLKASKSADIHVARALGDDASLGSWRALSWTGALLIVTALAWFMAVNNAAVSRTFFDLALIRSSAWKVIQAFGTNVTIFAVSAVLILI